MIERHGGAERLDAVQALSFDLLPIELSRDEEGELVEEVGTKLHYEMTIGKERRVRIEETLEDRQFVKLSTEKGIAIFMDGEPQNLAELRTVANEQSLAVLRHLDAAYGLFSGRLTATPGKIRKRDGVNYATAACELADSKVDSRVLLYVHPTELAVQRYDVFDSDNRRQATVVLGEFIDLDGFPMATEITFSGRDREPIRRWRLEAVKTPKELPADRFLKP